MRAAALLLVCALPARAEEGAPQFFIDQAALLRVASHMAAQCEDVQVDLDADIDLRVMVYDLLDDEGWSIDDPRLHSDAALNAVLARSDAHYAALQIDTPLSPEQVCPIARREASEGTTLGLLFRVDPE